MPHTYRAEPCETMSSSQKLISRGSAGLDTKMQTMATHRPTSWLNEIDHARPRNRAPSIPGELIPIAETKRQFIANNQFQILFRLSLKHPAFQKPHAHCRFLRALAMVSTIHGLLCVKRMALIILATEVSLTLLRIPRQVTRSRHLL